MTPQNRLVSCQVCNVQQSKYKCSSCPIVYCSVPCFKSHKASSCGGATSAEVSQPNPIVMDSVPSDRTLSAAPTVEDDEPLPEPKQLKPLTSLKWPYVPEESAYPDPLKRDDPKSLQLPQYEAIATSAAIRKTLASHPNLPALLISIDRLRGPDREQALQKALGVTAPDISAHSRPTELSDDVLALRELAEAIEVAVRGGKPDALGLDWGELP